MLTLRVSFSVHSTSAGLQTLEATLFLSLGALYFFCYFVYVLPAVLSFFVCVFVFLRNSRDCVSDILKEHPKASCTHRHTR